MRIKATGIGALMGVLTEMLESDRMKAEIPWWLAVIFAAAAGVGSMLIPDEYEDLADGMDALTVGLVNVAAGRVRESGDENRQQLSTLINEVKQLRAELEAMKQ